MANTISNTDNVIDSRDVIERIEELTEEVRSAWETKRDAAIEELDDEVTQMSLALEPYRFDDNPSEHRPEWILRVYSQADHPYHDEVVEYMHKLLELSKAKVVDEEPEFGDVKVLQGLELPDVEAEVEELVTLLELQREAEDYAPDWSHGCTLIHEAYFERYAEELAYDIGAISKDATWPNNFIDWEAAAKVLALDYTEVDFGGNSYLVR
jgi:hypothetical protein